MLLVIENVIFVTLEERWQTARAPRWNQGEVNSPQDPSGGPSFWQLSQPAEPSQCASFRTGTETTMADQQTLDFILGKLRASLRVKDDQWQRLLDSEHRASLNSFLQSADASRLLVYADGKDLVATTKPPSKLRKKTAYFLKLVRGPLAKEDLQRSVLAGELSEAPLDQLAALSSGVFLPLIISRTRANGALPDVVAKGLTDGLLKFVATVQVTAGQLKNQTLLPLPQVSEADLASPAPEQETVRLLENAVVTWTRQIRHVLASDPDAPFKVEGAHPGPLVELDYWADRAAQLGSICEQLAQQRPLAVMATLERARSTYLPAFARLCSDVEAARTQAADNCRFLRPLRRLFEKLNTMVRWWKWGRSLLAGRRAAHLY